MTESCPGSPRGLGPALGGLFAMAAGIGIGRFIYTPILPPMIEALGLSKSSAGLIASANFLGYLCGALIAAASRLPGSRRVWLLGSLVASAVTTGAMGLTGSIPAFIGLRFGGGVASALVLILASALVLEQLAQTGRGRLSSVHFAGVGVGIAVSAAVVAAMQAAGLDWPSLWQAGGALSLAATAVVAVLLPDHAGAPPPVAQREFSSGHNMALRRLTAAYGLFGFGYVITATFIVAIVRATPAIRPLEPAIWIVGGLSAAPSVMLWSVLARRTGIPLAFGLACLTQAIGVMASVVLPNAIGILLAAALLGGTFMGQTALGVMRGRELAFGDPRRAIAVLTGAFGVGQIIGPIFAGAAFDRYGSFTLPSCAAAVGLVVAAVLANIRTR
jgi:predicted MFS family arabinose efflux permease